MTGTYVHRREARCTSRVCYCVDPNMGDPICDCGAPAWACQCAELVAQRAAMQGTEEQHER